MLNATQHRGASPDGRTACPPGQGISRRTARDARSLLGTILGDAAAHKPPLIPYNPALRPRNRGRRTGRRLERGPQRAWATPLEALLTRRTGRAADRPGRRLHHDPHDRLHRPAVGRERSAWSTATSTPARSTSNGSSARSAAGSTGCRRRTTPTAAPTGNPASPSTCRRSWPRLLARQVQSQPRQPCACTAGARRQRPVRVPRPRRRPPPAEQLRPPRVPPRLRRTLRAGHRPARPDRHRRRHHLARRSRSPPGHPSPATRPGAWRATHRRAGGESGSFRTTSRSPAGCRWFPA